MTPRFIKEFTYQKFDIKVAQIGPYEFKAVAYIPSNPSPVKEWVASSVEEIEARIRTRLAPSPIISGLTKVPGPAYSTRWPIPSRAMSCFR